MKILELTTDGPLVKYLQLKLIALHYELSISSNFDTATYNAVINYQQKNGLLPDGKVGGKTWTKLYLDTEHPRDISSRIERHNDIMTLHPTVREAVVKVFVQLRAEGIPFRVFEAYRYPERQEELYAQGRTKPGSIVTYAKPWSSYHQYGLAVDFVLFINNDWSWNTAGVKGEWWHRMHTLGAEEGLMRLDFEVPHLQLIGTSSSALRAGIYPPNHDDAWYENMIKSITKKVA